MDFKMSIASEIVSALEVAFGETSLSAAEIAQAIEIPPDTALGDYAFPCFRLARKALRKAPADDRRRAQAAADRRALPAAKCSRCKGYLNFFIDRATYAREVLEQGARAWASATAADNQRRGQDGRAWTTPPSTSPSASTSAICPPP